MKRFLIAVFASCLTLAAYPQNHYTAGFKYLKGGISFNKVSSDDSGDIQRIAGADIVFGLAFVTQASNNCYIGYEFGIGSRGFKGEEEAYYTNWGYEQRLKMSHINLKVNPKLGLLINSSSLTLDIYFGIGLSYDISGNTHLYEHYWDTTENTTTRTTRYLSDYKEFSRLDYYIIPGVTIWLGTIGFDIAYQRGFNSLFDDTVELFTNNIIARIAFRF